MSMPHRVLRMNRGPFWRRMSSGRARVRERLSGMRLRQSSRLLRATVRSWMRCDLFRRLSLRHCVFCVHIRRCSGMRRSRCRSNVIADILIRITDSLMRIRRMQSCSLTVYYGLF